MSSINPYLIRAWFDWMEDNALSAHLVVATNVPNVDVPTEYIKDDQIVLCIDSQAVDELVISNTEVSFMASFNGISRRCSVPVYAVRAVYDIDSGRGTMFPEMEVTEPEENAGSTQSSSESSNFMKIIK